MVNITPIVAVIDVGSNSIKALVAARGPAGELVVLGSGTREARISMGISEVRPRLSEAGMQAGLVAIQELLAETAARMPEPTVLVATSAVRDAANGAEFRARVRAATGCDLRILSGDEEANLIGRGLTSDPALAALQDFYVFDLGGGSLECLSFRERRIEQAVSLPLGCVRLTERCVGDPSAPFGDDSRQRVTAACRAALAQGDFRFFLPPGTPAVFTGGTVNTARAIFAARMGQPVADTAAIMPVEELRVLLADMARLDLGQRRQVDGLPPARADVFPTALAIVIALAEIGDFSAFHHSVHNLRYGVAAELLQAGDRGSPEAV